MRHLLRLAVVVVLSSFTAYAAGVRPTGGAVPNEIVVKIRSNASANAVSAIAQQLDADESKHIAKVKDGSLYRMHSRSKNTEALAAALAHNPNVEYAEPNYVVHVTASPTDPSYASLWGLNNTGQVIYGVPGSGGADIDAEAAWAVTTGSSSIVVGVVDSGIDYTHPDLAANMWSNPGGKGNAACGAGTHGFNVIDGNCDPMDEHYHGTHVAGTIGAIGNNGVGVTGVNWNVSIMALKFLDEGGYGTVAGAVAVIDFAVQAKIDGVNVRVLSNSWGGFPFSKALLDVINKANENDILFVASAGNNTVNTDGSPHYPASYATANMISVAATDNRDRLAYFSNWGLKTVHLGAPGVDVLSTMPGNSYGYLDGTSMAAPHVSGVAALVLAKTPSLTTAQVKSAILDSVDVIPSLNGITTTGGRLNAAKAVGGTASPDFALTITPSTRTVMRGASASYTVSITPANGFSGAVNLTSTSLPAGISATFTPSSTSATSTMLVTTTNATAATVHAIPVTATSGSMVRNASATLSVLSTPALAACPTFSNATYSASAPIAVAIGDINRDGRADAATAEPGGNRVRVYFGNSSGFGSSVVLGVGTAPIAIAIGDFDGDGKPDLATANSGSNNVSIVRGNGDATFAAAVQFAAGTSPFALTAGDFDRDGDLDLAVANNGGSNISILPGQGNGTFAAPVNYATGAGPYNVAAGDLDGDGRLDLAVANFNANTVSLLRGNGDGTFQTATSVIAGQKPSAVAFADLDGDGRLDLAVSNYKTNNVSVLLGNGDGTFDPAVHYTVGLSPSSVAAGDLNADGNADLVTADTESASVSVLMGAGNGTYTTAISIAAPYSYYYDQSPHQAVIAEVNADARPDIVVADSGYYGFTYVRNLGDCTLNCGTVNAPSDQSAGSTPQSVATGDFNGDGNPDFAAVNSGGNSVSISAGNGNGGFTAGATASAGTTPHGIAAGDFDRDGKLDLAVGSSGSAQVVILRGNGDATFQSGVSYATATTPRSIAAGDFNRDGKLDLAVAARGSDVVSVLLGNGDGTFASAVDYGTGDEPEAVTIGDFNRDGKLDLATANAAAANVSILLGNGDGTFQTATSAAAGTTPQAILAADLNADGKPDLAVANGGSNNVSYLRGNGDGTFLAAVAYDAGTNPSGLTAADWTNDGRLDLATANTTSNDVAILIAVDGGSFLPPIVGPVGSGPAAIATADFNGDGKPDFVTANSGAATTSVLLDSCPVPDLTVAKTHSGSFTAGQSAATYTITVTNAGGGLTTGAVTVTDTLPSGLTATNISGTGWTCTLTPLVCARADALVGGGVYPPITLTVRVSGGAASSVTNTVSVSGGGEFNPLNNGASDVTAITQITDLSIVKTHTGNFALGATSRAYTLLVRNAGGQATSGTVTVTDALPAGLTATSMSGSGWSCNLGSLSCTRSDVLAGRTNYPPITVLVNVANNAPASVVNTATVSGGGDSNASNNTSSDTTAIWTANPCASFGRTDYSAGGSYTRGIAIADYNGDGRPDLAVSSYYDSKVSILLGSADGTFAAPVSYPANTYVRRLVAIDLDVDGDSDLAIVTENGVSVLLNNGAAVFSAPVLYSVAGGYLFDIAKGDFNGDGNPDVVVSSSYNGVHVLMGDGNGALGTPVSYAVSYTSGVAAADVNGDGVLDLVVPNNQGLAILLGQGGGIFGTATQQLLGEAITSVAIGDLTGDGKPDIAAGTSYYSFYILTGAGDGTFAKTNTISTSSYSGGRYVSVADLNADGNLDAMSVGDYLLTIASGNGDGTFQTPTAYSVNSYSSTPAAVGDFNGDGKADLALTNDYSGVSIMLAGCADLTITKTHSGDFRAGQNGVGYTLTVKNVGGAYSTGTITVKDILPQGLTAANLYGSSYYWNCTFSTLTCTTTTTLAPNETSTIYLYVNVSLGAPASVTNTATVSGGGDVNGANNTATDPTNIVHAPDLTVTKTHSGVFVVGGNGVYTITVGNIGTGATTDTVTVQDALPLGMNPVSMTGAGWSCNLANRTCTRSDVLGGTQSYPPITLTVSVVDGIAAQVNNFASVSGGGDTLTYNNSTLDPTSILVAPVNVVATAVSTTQVNVSWSTLPNVSQYEVLRATNNGPYSVIGTTVSGFFLDNGRSPNTVYLYKVRAYNGSTAGPLSVPDLVTMFTFTDDPLPSRATMKASYIEQLRTAINLVRAAANLAPLAPDGSAAAGWTGRASHITQLQTGLNAARTALGVPAISYFGTPFVGGPIQAGDIANLRAGVR